MSGRLSSVLTQVALSSFGYVIIFLFSVKTQQQGLFHYKHGKPFGLWLGFDVRSDVHALIYQS